MVIRPPLRRKQEAVSNKERERGFVVKRERGRKGGKIGRVGGDVTIQTAEEIGACVFRHQYFSVRVSLIVPRAANEVIAR
jgi:hypothetical protein